MIQKVLLGFMGLMLVPLLAAGAERELDRSCKGFADTFLTEQRLGTYGHPNENAVESYFTNHNTSQPYFNITSKSGHRFFGTGGTDVNYGNTYTVRILKPEKGLKIKRQLKYHDPEYENEKLVEYVFQLVAGKCVLREVRNFTVKGKEEEGVSFTKQECEIARLTESSQSLHARFCKPAYARFFEEDSADAPIAPTAKTKQGASVPK